MPKIHLRGQEVSYTIRESKRATTVKLRIDAQNGLQVVLPKGEPVPDILDLWMEDRADWILKHLATAETLKLPERQFVTGDKLLYLGEEKTLEVIAPPRKKRTTTALDGDIIRVSLPGDTPNNARRDAVYDALTAWYNKRAKAYIPPRVAEIAEEHGFEYGRIAIRNQKTRWGSCSTLGNLNFNQRLMMAPPDGIDYIIVHELCHLHEMNHSKRFWSLVGQHYPAYKSWEKWFKDNGRFLNL